MNGYMQNMQNMQQNAPNQNFPQPNFPAQNIPQSQVPTAAPATTNRAKLLAIIAAVEGVIIIGLTIALVISIATSKDRVSIIDGSSSAYNLDYDGEVLDGFRATCETNDKSYDFYKDGAYEIYAKNSEDPLEYGTYVIDETDLTIFPDNEDLDSRKAKFISNKLTDNGVTIDCTTHED